MKEKWKRAFLQSAFVFAECSDAELLKVGAVIVKDNRPITVGINGTPTGFRTNCCEHTVNGVVETIPEVIHAEANALDKLSKSHESSVGATMFCTHSPCLPCAVRIQNSGITAVYYSIEFKKPDGANHLRANGIPCERMSLD